MPAVLLIRTDHAAAVADALRFGRRVAAARVSPAAPGWTAVHTDDRSAAAATLDLSRRLDLAVILTDTAEGGAFAVCSRGRRLFCAGAAGDLGDTDMLAPFLVPAARLADLRGQALTPQVLRAAMGLPEPAEPTAAAITVECRKKRWWEFWV